MSKKNILNLGLLLIAAILASVIYFSNETNTDLAHLTNVDADTIDKITISHNDNATTIINKITDDLFIYAYDNQDYIECQKQINFVKLNRKMTPENIELLEELIRHIE